MPLLLLVKHVLAGRFSMHHTSRASSDVRVVGSRDGYSSTGGSLLHTADRKRKGKMNSRFSKQAAYTWCNGECYVTEQ
jgi:hypothetical protein